MNPTSATASPSSTAPRSAAWSGSRAAYHASKHGVIALSEGVRVLYPPFGTVTVALQSLVLPARSEPR